MAGKGFKDKRENQEKQSIHFRLSNELWKDLDVYCADKRVKKQYLFEYITKLMISNDHRMEEIVEEALEDKTKKRGLDEFDLEKIKEMIYKK